MSYTPHVWGCDESITDEKLNNIEEGIQEAIAKSEEHTSLSTVFEPHYKSFSGQNVDISAVHFLDPNYGWTELPVIYDADAYDNPLSIDWVYADAVYSYDTPFHDGKYNRVLAVEPFNYSVGQATPPSWSGALYVDDDIATNCLYIEIGGSQYVVLPDDSLVKRTTE